MSKRSQVLSGLILVGLSLGLAACSAKKTGKLTLNSILVKKSELHSTLSSVHIANNQITINGSGFSKINSLKIKGNGVDSTLVISSLNDTQIIASAGSALSLLANGTFDLIMGSASAQSTYSLTFTLQDGAVSPNHLSKSGAVSGDTLKFNGTNWVYAQISNSQTFLGTWDANLSGTGLEPSPQGGDYYIISTAGNFNDGSTTLALAVGDWLMFSSTSGKWEKVASGVSSKVSKSGDTMTGDLALNTLLKLKGANTNYVTVKASPTLATSLSLTLPASNGGPGQVLTTNGAGLLSWSTPSGSVSSVNTKSGAVTLTTDDVTEGLNNKYYSDNLALSAKITAPVLSNTPIATNDSLQVVAGKLQGQLSFKESVITAGTASQYLRGNKTLSTFVTDVINSTLSSFVVGTNTPLSSGDTILGAFGKVQAQINAKANATSIVDWTTINAVPIHSQNIYGVASAQPDKTLVTDGSGNITVSPISPSQLGYLSNVTSDIQTQINNITGGAGNWTANSGNVYRASGNVGVGTSTPGSSLDVKGVLRLSGSTSGYVGLAPATNAGSTTYILPSADGANGQYLATNGSGVLSWTTPAGSVTSVNAKSGTVILNTDDVTEGSINKYYSDNLALAAKIATPTLLNSPIAKDDSLQVVVGKLQGQLDTKATSTAVIDWTVANANPIHSQNIYGDITSQPNKTLVTDGSGKITISPVTPTQLNYLLNVTSDIQTQIDNITGGAGNWTASGGNVYRATGSVGIGISAPGAPLDVKGSLRLSGTNSGYVGLAPATDAGSTTYTLPSADGSNGQFLATNGSGVLSWTTPAGSVTSVNTKSGAVTLTTDDVTQGSSNKYYSDNLALAAKIATPTLTNSSIAKDDSLQVVVGKLQGQIDSKESALTAGTTSQYIRGDKTLSNFAIDAINSTLNSFAVGTNTPVSAGDTIVGAFGKVQGQLSAKANANSIVDWTTINAIPIHSQNIYGVASAQPNKTLVTDGSGNITVSPISPSQLGYLSNVTSDIQTQINNITGGAGNWSAIGGNVYRATGSVGIGTSSPGAPLDVKGAIRLSGSTSGYVGIAPAATAGSTTYTLPSSDGSSGQLLATNGSGVLSWTSAGSFLPLTGGTVTGNITVNANSALSDAMTFKVNGVTHSRIDGYGVFRSATVSTGEVYASGNIYAQSGLVATRIATDLELKANEGTGLTGLIIKNSSNNVGIGTLTPSQKLEVAGTVKATAFVGDGSGLTGIVAAAPGSTYDIMLNNSGNFSAANNKFSMESASGVSPLTKLNIGGTGPNWANGSHIELQASGGYYSQLEFFNGSSGSTTTDGATQTFTGTDFQFFNRESGYLSFGTANTERMRITSAGSVGIGTNNPQSGLDIFALGNSSALIVPRDTTLNRPSTPVNGMIRYNTTTANLESYANDNWVVLGGASGYLPLSGGLISGVVASNNGSGFYLNPNGANAGGPTYQFQGDFDTGMFNPAANNLGFSTGGVERVRVDSSGNVGIGITTPTNKLEVSGGSTSLSTGSGGSGALVVRANNGDPATTGTARTDIMRIGQVGGGAALDFGVSPTSGRSWLQTHNDINQSITFDLLLNPNGGKIGIGLTTPTAALHLKAGNASASGAPLKLTAGTNLTTPEAGAIEFDGTNLFYTDNTNTRQTLRVAGASAGITTLGGLSTSTQTFATSTSGSVLQFSSATSTHTLNIPMASTAGVTAGLISKSDYDNFNSKLAPFSTSSALAGLLSDETGTGGVVLSDSPVFTGVPLAPTAAQDTNTTQIATTAFIANQASSSLPLVNSTASAGSSLRYSRQDHVHPIDTSRAPASGSSSITTVGTITSGTWNGSSIDVAHGGTGKTSFTANTLLFGNGTTDISELALPSSLSTTSVLLSSITTGAPVWTTSTAGNFLRGSLTGVTFGPLTASDLPSGMLTGSGTSNTVPYYTNTSTLGDSPLKVGTKRIGINGNPVGILDVYGGVSTSGNGESIYMRAQAAYTNADGGDILLFTGTRNGTGRDGRVVIGPSSAAYINPPYDLTLITNGNSYPYTIGIPDSTGFGPSLLISAASAGSNSSGWSGGNVTIRGGNTYGGAGGTSNIYFQTAGGGTAGTLQTANTKMTITGTGEVGIGTTAPTSPLHVIGSGAGKSTIYGAATGSGASNYGVYGTATGLDAGNAGVYGYGVKGVYGNTSCAGGGCVGVYANGGTGAPAYGLYATNGGGGTGVYSVVTAGGYAAELVNNSASGYTLYASGSRPNYFNGNVSIGLTTAAYKLDINGDTNIAAASVLRFGGTQVCSSTGCTTSSDKRLKENINPLKDSLEKILKLVGIEFDYKDKSKFGNKHQIGVIAQDVEKVFPEVVLTDKVSGLKSVAYDHLIAPLIEAVKLLYHRILGIESQQANQARQIASSKEDLKLLTEKLQADNRSKDQKIKELELTNAQVIKRLEKLEKALNLK